MEQLNLLSDLALSDGITVILHALGQWVDYLAPEGSAIVSDDVREFCKSEYGYFNNHLPITEWPASKYRERLVLSFHRRMRARGPIEDATPPTRKNVINALDNVQLIRRAQLLAESAFGLSIPQAMTLFEEIVVEWSLICDEEWVEGHHVGYIFHLLAEITER